MARFRKKPVVIEAVQYEGNGKVGIGQVTEWLWRALKDGTCHCTNGTDPFIINTLEGEMTVSPGDWIIQGVQGELYPCKPDIFEETYDAVVEQPSAVCEPHLI